MSEPVDQLIAVGLPDEVATAYVALIERPDALPSPAIVGQLISLGLLTAAGHGQVRVLPPRWAIGSLVRRHREQLMAEDARLTATVVAAEDLQATFEHVQERRGGAPLIEVLHGFRAADAAIGRIAQRTERRYWGLMPGPSVDPRHAAHQSDIDALARGVEYRCIYSTQFLQEPGALEMTRTLIGHGEQARIYDGLPNWMLLFDDEVAVLPTDSANHPSQGAAIIRSSSVLQVCAALFEQLWERATPLEPGHAAMEDPLPLMLLTGFSDDQIARELGVSVRTVRRRIHDLMTRHGAATRIQLGAALARSADRAPAGGDGAGSIAVDPV